jgi:alpha-tubulin suppressor-like RCC1 family protein/uncharacterized protein YjdB
MSKHERSVRSTSRMRQGVRVRRLLRALAGLATLARLNACSDASRITPPPPPPPRPPNAVVSDPLALQAGAPQQSPAGLVTGAAERLVYVSLPSGAHPGGSSVTIRNTAGGPTVTQTMIDGGFDPVPIPAGVADTIQFNVRDSAGGAAMFVLAVPRLLKPSVVRTNPSGGKRDVPLNSRVTIVFSEPVDSASVKQSVALLRSGVSVPGVVRLFPDGVVAEFVPSTLLERRTTYRLEVTQGVRDLSGEALIASLSAEFTTGDSSRAPVTSVAVTPPSATLEMGDVEGDTVRLAATVMTAKGVVTDREVIWSTDNPKVAVVSSTGLVTPFALGLATITATSEGQLGSAQITVVPIPVARIEMYVAAVEITPSSATMNVGATLFLDATTLDRYGRVVSGRLLEWRSGDASVATVDQKALVTGLAVGIAPIIATSEGVSGTMPVRVGLPLTVDRVEITPRVTVIAIGGAVQLTAHAYKCNAQSGTCSEVIGQPLTWASGDSTVATVDQTGRVTAVKSGMSAITAQLDQIRGAAPITVLPTAPPTFAALSAGAYYTCGWATTLAVYCWGRNSYGELGIGKLGLGLGRPLPEDAPAAVAPLPVTGGLLFSLVSAGSGHACGLTTTGAAYCWGLGLRNRLGAPAPDACGWTRQSGDTVWTECAPAPIAVPGVPPFRAIYAGGNHTCALTAGGAAYCWGNDHYGQVGDGGGVTSHGLPPTPAASGYTFTTLSAGTIHTCGITPGGAAYCWGNNYYGQLGDGSYTNRDSPVAVAGGLSFASITAGVYHTCGVTTSGSIYCWGDNYYGQLGDGSLTSRNAPTVAVAGGPYAKVSLGLWHSCALTPGGAAYCWGGNWTGALGDGSGSSQSTPVPVAGGFTFAAITTGESHTCGLTTGQVVYCWGWNQAGQLGDGSATDRRTPTLVAGQR